MSDLIAEAIVEDERHRECVSALDCHIAPKGAAVSLTEYECVRAQYRRPILAALIAETKRAESAVRAIDNDWRPASEKASRLVADFDHAVATASAGLEKIAALHDCDSARCRSPHRIGSQIARVTLGEIATKENRKC